MEELVINCHGLTERWKNQTGGEKISQPPQSITWMEALMIPRPEENIAIVTDQTVRRDRQQEI